MPQTRTVELDERADHALLPQRFRDREHEVRCRRAFRQRAGQPVADDRRNQHRARLSEHRGLGFDAADTPSDDAQSVHHRRMRIGPEHRVRVGQRAAVRLVTAYHARQVFDVHLVNDAGGRRHDAEIPECRLAPAQEDVPLPVAVVFELRVELERVRPAEVIDLHGVIDDQLDGLQRIHALGIAAQLRDAVAHGGQIDDAGHAREILEQDARRHERDLGVAARRRSRARGCHPRGRTSCPPGGSGSREGS